MCILSAGIVILAENPQCSNLFWLVNFFLTDDLERGNGSMERVNYLESLNVNASLRLHELGEFIIFFGSKVPLIKICICGTKMKQNTAIILRHDC